MNIIEAAEAAKAGKRVAFKRSEAVWADGRLQWENNPRIQVAITEDTLDNYWRIIPDPPKLYPFSVAFERMKQGHWMKSIVSERVIRFSTSHWVKVTKSPYIAEVIEPVFTVYEIEGRWQEVTE